MSLMYKKQQGFTLIEMIVSLAVFSVVITISVGALLTLIATNQQLQNEQSVMTNLSFALDSMTREIRTGTNYVCGSVNNTNNPLPANPPGLPGGEKIFDDGEDSATSMNQDCVNGRANNIHGISFIETGNSITGVDNARIVYYFDDTQDKIFRRVDGGDAQSIVSSGIVINEAEFFVTGSNKLSDGAGSGYEDQASVTIFIEAQEKDDPTAKKYRIQTTVTQRTLDI